MTLSLTEHLARLLTQIDREALPLDTASDYVLDWLGSALAGTQTPQGKILLDYAAAQPPVRSQAIHRRAMNGTTTNPTENGATVLALAVPRSADVAALTNGGLSHILEMDDLDRGSVLHPGTVVIPAALAVAERERKSGPDFLRAVVLGYEVAIRIGEAVGQSHYRYFHNTATCGVFGAAAAAAALLDLTEEQTVWALGSAGTMSAGLWEFNREGSMSKHLHAGRAAQTGVLAADLARRGFTGARTILEGERGFLAATSKDADPSKVVASLDRAMTSWKISGVSLKPHASCRHTHPAVDAALGLSETIPCGAASSSIRRVEIETYQAALDLCDNPAPATPYQAKFSLQYCVALALARGHAGLADFTPEQIRDPLLASLMARTALRHNRAFEQVYPRQWPAHVTIACADGRVLSQTVYSPKGDPENPLSQGELEEKFRQMLSGHQATRSGTRYDADAWLASVRGLDRAERIVLPQLISDFRLQIAERPI